MTAKREVIDTVEAPRSVGPYSQAIRAQGLIFCAGQAAFDPRSGQIVPGEIREQTRRTLLNLQAILQAAGSDLDRVVKVTIFLESWEDFGGMNEVFAEFFGTDEPPARSTVQGTRWPEQSLVAIEAIAIAE